MASPRLNTLQQLLIAAKGLTQNLQGLNTAAARAQARGTGLSLGANNPMSLDNLKSPQFWTDVFRKQDQVRTRALALNTTTPSLAAAAGEAGIGRAGFTNAVMNQMEMLSTGLDQHLTATRDLGLEMRATGQNENKLFQTLRQSQVLGGLTNRGIENLSDTMLELSHTYNISTEALIESFQEIASNMDVATLGMTEQFADLNLSFAKQFGPGMTQILTKMEENFAAGQTFAYDQLVGAMGGIGSTIEEARVYIGRYTDAVGNFMSQFGPEMRAKGLELAKGIFGPQGQLAFNLTQAMEAVGNKPTVEGQNKFATLQTAMATLYTPIDKMATSLLPSLIENIGLLTGALITAQGVGMFGGAVEAFGGLKGAGAALTASPLMTLARFLPAAAVVGGGLWFLINALTDKSEEQLKLDKDRFDIEKAREQREINESRQADQLNTARYMQLQSQTLNESIERAIFNADISRAMASEKDRKKIELQEKLISIIGRIDPRFMGQSRPSMDGAN